MKKLVIILTILVCCLTTTCTHVHDENCGYDPTTKTGCTHQCNQAIDPHHENGGGW